MILLQAGKGGGMGAGLGGGAASQTVFGGRGSQTFLGRVTSISAALFMMTSLWLAYHSSRTTSIIDEGVGQAAPAQQAPAPDGPPAEPAQSEAK